MEKMLDKADVVIASKGYVADQPQLSSSLHAICYTDEKYLEVERHAILQKTWQGTI